MWKYLKTRYSLGVVISSTAFLALGLSHAPAFAQAPEPEPAIVWTVGDPGLQWGPCPAFLPEGCEIAVLHGDPAKENADIFFRVPAGSEIPLHRHTSAERMVLVEGELQVTYEGQYPTVLKSGTYAYGPAGRPHAARCAAGGPCVLFIAFEAPVDAAPVEIGPE